MGHQGTASKKPQEASEEARREHVEPSRLTKKISQPPPAFLFDPSC
jgi:hypothetical protein